MAADSIPANAAECRRHAASCLERSFTAQRAEDKLILKQLAEQWAKLADEIEHANTLLGDSIQRYSQKG